MARNDGINRTSARNVNLTAAKIGNAQRHNEREKESYTNPDIIPERTPQNIHFKKPTTGYAEMFAQMEKDGVISTRGLKSDANLYGELIFDDQELIDLLRSIFSSQRVARIIRMMVLEMEGDDKKTN